MNHVCERDGGQFGYGGPQVYEHLAPLVLYLDPNIGDHCIFRLSYKRQKAQQPPSPLPSFYHDHTCQADQILLV